MHVPYWLVIIARIIKSFRGLFFRLCLSVDMTRLERPFVHLEHNCTFVYYFFQVGELILPAYLLVHCLLELLVVDDSSDLALAVCGPVGCGHLNGRVANINPSNTKQ